MESIEFWCGKDPKVVKELEKFLFELGYAWASGDTIHMGYTPNVISLEFFPNKGRVNDLAILKNDDAEKTLNHIDVTWMKDLPKE